MQPKEAVHAPDLSTGPRTSPAGLRPVRVYRDGPRYYVAEVTDGSRSYQYKRVIGEESYYCDIDGLTYTPAIQLTVECHALAGLSNFASQIDGYIPNLVSMGGTSQPWYLQEHIEGRWLGMSQSPFFFAEGALRALSPAKAVSYFTSLQALTTVWANDNLVAAPARRAQTNPLFFEWASQRVAAALETDEAGLLSVVEAACKLTDEAAPVITHLEPYPPHLFLVKGQLAVIDWENARLDHRYADLAKLWARAYEWPEWQEEFLEHLHKDDFEYDLWDAALLLSLVGLYPYLTDIETTGAERRTAALRFCEKEIRSLIA
jgi:hypothetical protein